MVGAAPRRHEGDGGATLQGILFVQAEEEEEEEEADASYLLSSWPRSSSTTTVVCLLCWFYWLRYTSRYVPFWRRQAKMLRIMAGLVQKDSCSGMARLVLLVILHLALFLLFVRPMMLGIMAGMLWKDSCLRRSGVHVVSFLGDDFRNGFWKNFTRRSSSWLSPYSAQCLVRHWIHAVWFVAPCLEREVLRGVRVHSSSCGAHRDVVHSPFGWLYHRCHYNCRGLVLFVGRLPWLCGPFLLRECLRRDVVWWCIFHSWWCLRFCLGQCEADGWKIPHQLFPVPRGRWVCMHAELLVQQQ